MITLGINYSQMHDSSACIVRDGELLFAVAEERLSRIKHDAGFPHLAIEACFEFTGVRAEQLDEVCFGRQTAGPGYRHDLKLYALGGGPISDLKVMKLRATIWPEQSADAVCGSSLGARDQRLRMFRVRGFGDRRDGWPRGVGIDVDLAREKWPRRARADDSVSRFRGTVLQRVHRLPWLCAEQR